LNSKKYDLEECLACLDIVSRQPVYGSQWKGDQQMMMPPVTEILSTAMYLSWVCQ